MDSALKRRRSVAPRLVFVLAGYLIYRFLVEAGRSDCTMVPFARSHARTHARSHSCTHARTHARLHVFFIIEVFREQSENLLVFLIP